MKIPSRANKTPSRRIRATVIGLSLVGLLVPNGFTKSTKPALSAHVIGQECTATNDVNVTLTATLTRPDPYAMYVWDFESDAPRCNGLVYCIGGSEGSSNAADLAAAGAPAYDIRDLIVCLSGVYDFADLVHLQTHAC